MSNFESGNVMGGAGLPDKTVVMPGTSNATMQMPASADPFRTQMGGVTTCIVCKASTSMMDSYCGECGFLLSSAGVASEEIVLPEAESPIAELIDPQSARRYRLHVGANSIGRQDTDVLVSDGTVSRHHANIIIENGAISVVDLGSSNGTKVGETRLIANQSVAVIPGTPVRFGNWNVLIELNSARPTSPANPTLVFQTDGETLSSDAFSNESTFTNIPIPENVAALFESPSLEVSGNQVATLRKTEGPADDIIITEGAVSLGRKPGNTIVLVSDAYLSSKHVEFVTANGETVLVDLGSTNGTVVNGRRMTANTPQPLVEGDEVQLGQTKYRFEPLLPTDAELALACEEKDELLSRDLSETTRTDFRGQA